MKTRKSVLAGVATVTILVATALASVARGVEAQGSEVEQVAREKLNCDIVKANIAADERYGSVEAEYQQQKKLNEELLRQTEAQNAALRQQYETLRKNYEALALQYRQQGEQTGVLHQQYEDLQKRYQEFGGHS